MRGDRVTYLLGAMCVAVLAAGIWMFLDSLPDDVCTGQVNASVPSPVGRDIADRLADVGPEMDETHCDAFPSQDAPVSVVAEHSPRAEAAAAPSRPAGRRRPHATLPERTGDREPEPSAVVADSTASHPGTSAREAAVEKEMPECVLFEVRTVGEQTITEGGYVSVETIDPIRGASVEIPSGTRMKAKCHIDGERILMTIVSARIGRDAYQLSMQVCDCDGIEGIALPDSFIGRSGDTAAAATAGAVSEAGSSLSGSLPRIVSAAGREIVRGVERGIRDSRSRRGIRLPRNERLYLKFSER